MAIVWLFAERKLWVVVSAIIVLFAGYAASVLSDEVTVTLSGNQEIPPVTTSAPSLLEQTNPSAAV